LKEDRSRARDLRKLVERVGKLLGTRKPRVVGKKEDQKKRLWLRKVWEVVEEGRWWVSDLTALEERRTRLHFNLTTVSGRSRT